MRIVSKWQEGREPEELQTIAGTVAYNSWKIGHNALTHVGEAGFKMVSAMQELLIVAEFMMYQLQVADRLLFDVVNDTDRGVFIRAMADKSITILADNRADLQGEGDYRDDFVGVFNARLQEYSGFDFSTETGPGYGFMRLLGEKVGDLVGTDQKNKWAMDMVVDIEAPDVYQAFRKQFDALMGV
jgi:hypothetical protein